MPRRANCYNPIPAGRHPTPPRLSASRRGYDATWRALRLAHLQENPTCVECEKHDRTVAATVVDHIRAHRGDDALRLDPENLQSLCQSHHSAKTCRQDRGLGRAPKGGTRP